MNQHGRAQAYIVSVGGFLGMGDRYVAVNPSEIKITYNDSDKKWHCYDECHCRAAQISTGVQIHGPLERK